MALTKNKGMWVSLSTARIPVYDRWVSSPVHNGGVTAGGNVIAEILKDEFYALLPENNNSTSHTVIVQNPNKQKVTGYIETSQGVTLPDYSWVAQQHPYHSYNSNGTTLVPAATEVINGVSHYIFTVHGQARACRDASGASMTTIGVGMQLACRNSETGANYTDHMLFQYKRLYGGAWQNCVSGGSSTYGYVDMGFTWGVFPNSRAVR